MQCPLTLIWAIIILIMPYSKRLCTIVTPRGKYEYQCLPMGLCNSPNIFQECMFELFLDLEYIRSYIDDLLMTSYSTFEEHLEQLEKVFSRLSKVGLKVNANKSHFTESEIKYLGYWITWQGIPTPSKKARSLAKHCTT